MNTYRFCTISKNKLKKSITLTVISFLSINCSSIKTNKSKKFKEDVSFVQKYQNTITLKNRTSAILIVPSYEARVMTSTTNSDSSFSNGYLDYDFIKSNSIKKGGNAYGGEDRLWLGPLGSKYTLFYDGKDIKGENWFIPKAIDAEPYEQLSLTGTSVHFRKNTNLKNNIGTIFNISIDRKIKIFSKSEIENQLHINLPLTISSVGFQSKNIITNLGDDWVEKEGIIAPWVLGMFKGNKKSVTVFPIKNAQDKNIDIRKYLNSFSEERMKIKDSALFFKTDGLFRSKIGVPKQHAKSIIGNYDAKNSILTIVTFSFNHHDNFLSSVEKEIDKLYDGDVVNSYNNSGKESSPTFFELESAASGKILKSGKTNTHIHNTFHFEGDETALSSLSKQLLGCNLNIIKSRF